MIVILKKHGTRSSYIGTLYLICDVNNYRIGLVYYLLPDMSRAKVGEDAFLTGLLRVALVLVFE